MGIVYVQSVDDKRGKSCVCIVNWGGEERIFVRTIWFLLLVFLHIKKPIILYVTKQTTSPTIKQNTILFFD